MNFKTNQQRRVPITRNGLFYDREQFQFDMDLGKEYIEGDVGQRIVLYSVDIPRTNSNDLYGEANNEQITYAPPIEIPCIYEIEAAELRSYDKQKNMANFQKGGKLKFSVYTSTLLDYGRDIKAGDMIGVQASETEMLYYTVDNDGRNNYDNGKTLFGTVPVVRDFIASPVEKSIFNG